ncbi:MAG: hypothetical protein JAY75_19555 [Candidatus Thiodiazotropha taylori]|nr:hypothetical protein [Candidatus Thiodiazotropha taylori]MCW4310415.1 hypothetical protein [Candidatus Thiodiazotropha endolucinida]
MGDHFGDNKNLADLRLKPDGSASRGEKPEPRTQGLCSNHLTPEKPLVVSDTSELDTKGTAVIAEGGSKVHKGSEPEIVNVRQLRSASQFTGGTPLVARVTVAKRQVIPPNSVMRVKCSVDQELPDYVIEPVDNLEVLGW